ncbi:hypothetical protein [Microvirga arsenatis]|uniref:Uncharacterized protein n=1 Tax=Microvirga arsenatis TaxID=2692265 RepID=A0ABW9YVI7_9HYPH|nr:hypothetical protein [Microvirga arsenatis]NBJ10953.1 hypothetical protein [Microvirga arsenatis]NBJ24150.1 hypothetical protein [Microvirga arsenatis]
MVDRRALALTGGHFNDILAGGSVMVREESMQKLDRTAVKALAGYAEGRLRESLAQLGDAPTISVRTREGVAKRLTAKNVTSYSTAEKLPFLIAMEIESLGDRIRLYPFTTRYREIINSGPRDMSMAWQIHSYSLRQGELYIIQERGAELIRFLHYVASDLGVPTVDRSNNFQKAFKKQFDRRLRERHRLVHAHERPSLTSRVIDFALVTEDADRETVGDTLAGLAVNIAHLLPGEPPENAQDILQRLSELRNSYVTFAETEAKDMFEILSTEVRTTLDPSSSAK